MEKAVTGAKMKKVYHDAGQIIEKIGHTAARENIGRKPISVEGCRIFFQVSLKSCE